MPAGVQGRASWAIYHVLFSFSLRAWLCEKWEQICTCSTCKLPRELTWGAKFWLSWLEIYLLIKWNFEKVCREEARTGWTKGLRRNGPSYLVLSQSYLQEECLSFLNHLCSSNAWLCSQCFTPTAVTVLAKYCKFILKFLKIWGGVVFCFVVVIFVVFFCFLYFKILLWLQRNSKNRQKFGS